MWAGGPGTKALHTLKRLYHLIRETLCKLSSWASTQMEGSPKNVPGGRRARWKLVCSWFDLCLFINMRVPDVPRSAVCPRLVISSRRAAIAPCAGTRISPPSYTGWGHSFHSLVFDAPFSLLCLDTVAKVTMHDHFLFLIIYQWSTVLISSSICWSVRTWSSPAVLMPSPPSYLVIKRRLL